MKKSCSLLIFNEIPLSRNIILHINISYLSEIITKYLLRYLNKMYKFYLSY